MSAEGLTGLATGLSEAGYPALKTLNLLHCDIGPEAGEAFGQLFERLPSLEVTILCGNPRLFSAEGLTGLATGLGEVGHPTPKVLGLLRSYIVPEAGEAL